MAYSKKKVDRNKIKHIRLLPKRIIYIYIYIYIFKIKSIWIRSHSVKQTSYKFPNKTKKWSWNIGYYDLSGKYVGLTIFDMIDKFQYEIYKLELMDLTYLIK
jgi:hypothetical protein